MELRFKYKKEECIRAFQQYQFIMKRVSKLRVIGVPMMTFACIAWIMAEGANIYNLVLLVGSGIMLCVTIYLLLIKPEIVYRNTKRYHHEYIIGFTKDEIHFRTEGVDMTYGWDLYTGFYETREFYFLIQGRVGYSVLPKRVLSSRQADLLRQFVKMKF